MNNKAGEDFVTTFSNIFWQQQKNIILTCETEHQAINMEMKDGKQAVYAKTRAEWRDWLKQNSQSEKSVWAILYHKKSKAECISINEATEEALCFGWIDSLSKKRDAESYYLTFTPRNPKSKWSKPNRDRAERLIAQGLMTPQGQQLIDVAKNTGRWEPVTEA